MKKLITCLVVCLLSGATFATTWTVDDDGKADFNNIQAAVDAASDGDEIIVMPGTYIYTGSGDNNYPVLNPLGKAITIRSSAPDNPNVVESTIINGEGKRRGIICWSGENDSTFITGFTITNCTTPSGGAGIFLQDFSSPRLENCVIIGNVGEVGGGMYFHNRCSPSVTNCVFSENSAHSGAGLRISDNFATSPSPIFQNCTFENNIAQDVGGGIYIVGDGNISLIDCVFENNSADYGGGMKCKDTEDPILTGCSFINNTAIRGGGLELQGSSVSLDNCIFNGNIVSDAGAGVQGLNNSEPIFSNCIFINNKTTDLGGNGAGANFSSSNPTLINSYFSNNESSYGGAMWLGGNNDNTAILNCVFEWNTAIRPDGWGDGGALYLAPTIPGMTIDGCRFSYNAAGYQGGAIKNQNASNPSISDSYFCGSSPNHIAGNWKDAGENEFSEFCFIDDDGDGIPDKSDNCYLYNPKQLDCNNNGVGDICDIADGMSADLNGNAIPDECECLNDINVDGNVDVNDILILIGNWGSSSAIGDVNFDGIVDVSDLLIVVGNWGACE